MKSALSEKNTCFWSGVYQPERGLSPGAGFISSGAGFIRLWSGVYQALERGLSDKPRSRVAFFKVKTKVENCEKKRKK